MYHEAKYRLYFVPDAMCLFVTSITNHGNNLKFKILKNKNKNKKQFTKIAINIIAIILQFAQFNFLRQN